MATETEQILSRLDDILLESDLEVLLADPFIEKLVTYNHEYVEVHPDVDPDSYRARRYRNHIRMFVKDLYRNFHFLVSHMNEYEILVSQLCKFQNQHLRYWDAMILHYNVPVTPVLEMFINRVHKDLEELNIFVFSYEYKDLKFRSLTTEYARLVSAADTKKKLTGFITLEAQIKSVFWSKTYIDKYNDLMDQVKVQIEGLRNLMSMGLLPNDDVVAEVPRKTKSMSRIATKRKTDFIKILSAMYDAGMFVDALGEPATNKQKLMEDLGAFMNDDFSSYSASLSQAKTRDEKTFMKPFRDIEKAAKQYFNE